MSPPKEAKESKQSKATEGKDLPKWKKEKQNKPQEERAVNPMTMIPEDVSISGKMPLPPKAKQLKRLYGF
jgi:hypothetical protein